MENLVFVIYDGIRNSAFAGQVLQPILKRMDENPDQKVYLISFEREKFNKNDIDECIPKKDNLFFIILKRTPFVGRIGLYYSVYQIKKILNQFKNEYTVICRGALAGWIFIKALDNKELCKSFIIQARGILPEEHQCTYPKTKNFLKNIFNYWREIELTKVELEAYKPKFQPNNFKIESVTIALKNHLVDKYQINKDSVVIASYDIPDKISEEKLLIWKKEIRSKLNLASETHIYCYNGSIKSWQSADLVIEFFKKELINNKNIFLLVLTQEKNEFEKLLIASGINIHYYKVLNVNHSEIYKYLAACNTGLVFRDKHIVSWVSRPIKALEYQSVGLKIVHNNTVKWLIDYT